MVLLDVLISTPSSSRLAYSQNSDFRLFTVKAALKKVISRGFTLLEVLLAVVLFTTSFTVIAGAISAGLSVGGDNENSLIGANLASEKMETLKRTSYAGIANETKAAVSGFSPFQREVVVTTPVANLKQATVTVYWNHKDAEISYSLVTYFSNI